jgi:hypothetical protein
VDDSSRTTSTVSYFDLLMISVRIALARDASRAAGLDDDAEADSFDNASLKAAAAAGLRASRSGDSVTGVAWTVILEIVRHRAYQGPSLATFLTDVLELLGELNGLTLFALSRDAEALVAHATDACSASDVREQIVAAGRLRTTVEQIFFTDSDGGDWTSPEVEAGEPEIVLLSPMNSAQYDDDRCRCQDAVLEASRQLQAMGWKVWPYALIHRDDTRSHDELVEDHKSRLRAAVGVVAIASPPSLGVGYALALVPADTPLLILVEAARPISRLLDPKALRKWSTDPELIAHVRDFASRLKVTGHASVHRGGPELTASRRSGHTRGAEDFQSSGDSFLPGLDNESLLPQFQPLVSGADVTRMSAVLANTDWQVQAWLSPEEMVLATTAKRHYGWTDREFGDALAYANMLRAYEHHAPLVGIPTRRRRLDSIAMWDHLRRQRVRDERY